MRIARWVFQGRRELRGSSALVVERLGEDGLAWLGLAWLVEVGGSLVAPTHPAASWSSTLLVPLRRQAIELLVTMPHLTPSR